MRLMYTLLLSVFLLSACGHKGPLYLPAAGEDNRTASTTDEKK